MDLSNENDSTNSSNVNINDSFLKVVLTTFTAVFIAELGDKTQVATLLLSAQSGKPYVVFIGAATALIASSLVGVLVGKWLGNIFPQYKIVRASGLLMIGLSVWIALQAINALTFTNSSIL